MLKIDRHTICIGIVYFVVSICIQRWIRCHRCAALYAQVVMEQAYTILGTAKTAFGITVWSAMAAER